MSKQDSELVGERVRIYKRGDTYWANLQHRCQQLRKSLKTNNIKTARRLALAWEQEILGGSSSTSTPREPSTVDRTVEMFLAACEAEQRARKTLTKYRGVLQRVIDMAAEQRLTDILQIDLNFVDRYRQSRRAAERSPKTIHTEVAIIRQLVRFARSRRLITMDPLDGLRNHEPKGAPQPFWTHDDVQRILSSAQEPQRSVFTFLNETGMRIGEVQWLTWDDVDFSLGVIHVRSKPGWTTKTGNIRSVPMTPIARDVLTKLPRHTRWVFTAPASVKYPNGDHQISERRLLKSLKRVLEKLKLPGHLHTFRHSYISRAIINGTPEAMVRSWVGHVDEKTIRLYTHIASQQSQQAMQTLHQKLWGDTPG
ncbi:MAG: site-specific integrase [Planctomycetaceae bacterium]|nr:site-specific integrase [Planctomycetaceae bacterium]